MQRVNVSRALIFIVLGASLSLGVFACGQNPNLIQGDLPGTVAPGPGGGTAQVSPTPAPSSEAPGTPGNPGGPVTPGNPGAPGNPGSPGNPSPSPLPSGYPGNPGYPPYPPGKPKPKPWPGKPGPGEPCPKPTPTWTGEPKPMPSCAPGLVPAETLAEPRQDESVTVTADSVDGTTAQGMVEGQTVWKVKHQPGDCVSP